ncbi:MAG TPA: DUF4435 domain-containing protein [Candidatus Methanomethylophilaceae archaeon]|nr:DUF4435 domain-containing protein [Candidatus Methanomethylophilaceae archaeon]
MRNSLTPTDIANEISMLISSSGDTVLAVEGITDSRLYSKFSDDDNVKVVIGHSKSNVRKAVDECWHNRNINSVVGIVDADLDRIQGKKRTPPIFQTDYRDLEIMMMSSPALYDILIEYADIELLESFTSKYGPVFDAVISACYPIGLLMHISEKYKLSLCFKNLDFNNFIDRKSLRIDEKRLVNDIISCTVNPRINKKKLLDILSDESSIDHDLADYARGHDAVDVLLIALRYTFGSFNCKNIQSGELSGSLRLAFSDHYFAGTNLYDKTDKWSKKKCFKLWSLNVHL